MQGQASVVDGDTVEIAGQRMFNGIDAPESRQYCNDAKGFAYPCGRRAAQALGEFVAASLLSEGFVHLFSQRVEQISQGSFLARLNESLSRHTGADRFMGI
jgi:hypothetical protein